MFRLAANLLQPATVAVICSKNRKDPIICCDLAVCNGCCNLWLVWTKLKGHALKMASNDFEVLGLERDKIYKMFIYKHWVFKVLNVFAQKWSLSKNVMKIFGRCYVFDLPIHILND